MRAGTLLCVAAVTMLLGGCRCTHKNDLEACRRELAREQAKVGELEERLATALREKEARPSSTEMGRDDRSVQASRDAAERRAFLMELYQAITLAWVPEDGPGMPTDLSALSETELLQATLSAVHVLRDGVITHIEELVEEAAYLTAERNELRYRVRKLERQLAKLQEELSLAQDRLAKHEANGAKGDEGD